MHRPATLSITPWAIVQKASDLGVSVLAITDHNHVGGVAAFRAAAEGRGIHIFPGFELSSSEGIHVLCIYAPDTADDLLARYLGGFGITDTKPSVKLADKAFVDILAKVREQGGVAIAAHVTNDNGLLKVLTGQARIQAWRSEDLLAIQIPGPVADLPYDAQQIVENTNPNYRRDHAAKDGLAIAVVNAKDIAKPEDLDDRSATCWVKMSEVTISRGCARPFWTPARASAIPRKASWNQRSTPSSSRSPGREDSSTAPLSTSIQTSTSWSGAAGPASRP